MLSVDLENLACALEQVSGDFTEDNAAFIQLVCSNLHSLAHRVCMLEAVPLDSDFSTKHAILGNEDNRLPLQ